MSANSDKAERLIDECVRLYKSEVRSIDSAAAGQDERAYGGVVRMAKGKLVETIAQKLLLAAWIGGGKDAGRVAFNTHPKYDIPMKKEYADGIADKQLRREMLAHLGDYKVKHGADIHVYVDGDFVLSTECKAFTENAMLKRILFDAYLLKTRFPHLRFVLVQLESQLGGDYSKLPPNPRGSKPSHTLMSYMDVGLEIITLLRGERKVDRPIHKADFYKPLTKEALQSAVSSLAKLMPD